MIPDNWARSDAPSYFDLPGQADELVERCKRNGIPIQLGQLLGYLDDSGATRAYVEAPYIDFDYRSEYSNLYSRSFNPPSDKTERLLFFAGDTFLGFCVVRPSFKPVGRTAVKPPPDLEPFVSCLAPHTVRPYGLQYEMEGWPFLSQDGVYGRCAHAAIWSIARYHHLRHGAARHSIASVVEASGTRPEVDRTFRSGGLYLTEVAAAFAGLGLPALSYIPESLPSGEDLEAVICRYLNSGFPVALNTPGHLTVLIGYGHKNGELFFVRSDDNEGPYERLDNWKAGKDRLKSWEMLLVPLPARIHVPCEAAEIQARRTFLEQAGATPETESFADALDKNELRVRTYAINSAVYKNRLARRHPSEEVIQHHRRTPASVWLWVSEFQRRDIDSQDRVIGEVVIDATSHPSRPQPLMANLPGRCVAWLPEDSKPRGVQVKSVERYDSALPTREDTS